MRNVLVGHMLMLIVTVGRHCGRRGAHAGGAGQRRHAVGAARCSCTRSDGRPTGDSRQARPPAVAVCGRHGGEPKPGGEDPSAGRRLPQVRGVKL